MTEPANAIDHVVRVEVSDEKIIPGRSGTDKSGRAYTIPAKHVAYIHQGDRYPIRTEVAVPETGPLRPGFYFLAGKCFVVGEFSRLKFTDRQLALVPVEEVAAALNAKPALKAAS